MKSYGIGKIKRTGKCKSYGDEIYYYTLRYLKSQGTNNKRLQKTEVARDKDGQRLEWYIKPKDSYQKSRNNKASEVLDLLLREKALERDKGNMTWSMIEENIKPLNTDLHTDNWGEFVRNNMTNSRSNHISNYLSWIERQHPEFLTYSIKDVCSETVTERISERFKEALEPSKGIVQSSGKPYSPVTLAHYWFFHVGAVLRAKRFELIDEIPPNCTKSEKDIDGYKTIVAHLKNASKIILEEKKGAYTTEEVKKVDEYMKYLSSQDPQFVKPRFQDIYLKRIEVCKMFLFSTLFTGLREGDLMTLDWSMIQDYDDDNYKLVKRMNKTSREVTIIFNKKKSKPYIGTKKAKGLVFDTPQDENGKPYINNFWKHIKKILELKKNGRKVLSFGMSRHTHAYRLINALQKNKSTEGRFDLVQTRLGHTNIKTTFSHYVSTPDKYYERGAKVLSEVGDFDV
tara:strand:+ start:966 stop:2333 length:1368 start_codon:yes stop_codon:yes gene_type:complete